MLNYLDGAARALEAVELIARSYGRRSLVRRRGVEGEDGGGESDEKARDDYRLKSI